MLEVISLRKSFKVPKKKQKENSLEKRDPRDEGKIFHAVRDVSFSCEPGQILGLLGANGAGKTTTLRILATALKPSSGTARMDGVEITKDPLEVKRRIGFLSGSTGVYGRLSAREMIQYFGQLHGLDKQTLKKEIDELESLLDMGTFMDKRCDSLSTGMKQKVNIARTLIHNPSVIFFDEPTSGLDVMSARTIVDFVKRCKERGKTVILSTHIMHEVEKLCDSVCIIHQGMNVYSGEVDGLKARTGQQDLDEAFVALLEEAEAGHE